MFCRKPQPIKKIASDAALETHDRLLQLEKDNEYMRRAIQKMQSDLNEVDERTQLNIMNIHHRICTLEIAAKKLAIPEDQKPKAKGKRDARKR